MAVDFSQVMDRHVKRAIQEYDNQERQEFLKRVRARKSVSWFISEDHRDLKAVAARALQIANRSDQIGTKDFNTMEAVARIGNQLGFPLEWLPKRPTQIDKSVADFDPARLKDERRTVEQKISLRQGQAAFRKKLIKAYGKCSISGERTEEVLEAAHIIQYLGKNTNHIQNGLLLRADLHALFDYGLIMIGPDYKIVVGASLANTEYARFDHKKIKLPKSKNLWPHIGALQKKSTLMSQKISKG